MTDFKTFMENLYIKGYRGGKDLVLYLLSEGKSMQEMIDICLEYTNYNFKKQ